MIRAAAILFCALTLSGCLGAGSAGEALGDVLVLEGIGTPEACLASDTRCLESKFTVECDLYAEDAIETCRAWLAELEGLAEPVHPQIKLLSAEQYRSKVRELSQEVHDNDRHNVGAMQYLSLTSDSDEESLQWRRRIVRTNPSRSMDCRMLRNALNRVLLGTRRE